MIALGASAQLGWIVFIAIKPLRFGRVNGLAMVKISY